MAAIAAIVAMSAACGPAAASKYLRVGIYDDAQALFGPSAQTIATYKKLGVQEMRVTLYWGGPHGVALKKPTHGTDPGDAAYNWSLYDRVVQEASAAGIHVLFSIYGTPAWANGDKGLNVAATDPTDLRNFAYAAARRYSGTYIPAGGTGKPLPAVRDWLAWNEPNNPVFLTPQYKKVKSKWVIESAVNYAKICNGIYNGVHATLLKSERVGCGATAPRGNNDPLGSRPSVSPLAFLRAVKADGLKTFDAWAHHPYYASPSEAPSDHDGQGSVDLGNIGDLISLVTQLYGNKRIWITEYGYETNPPDKLFGVSYSKQALYLKEAFAIARKNPRIDMMMWFLLVDEKSLAGWQSGLITAGGVHKPSFNAFTQMAKTK